MTLNEECGLLQWVPNVTPIRPVLDKLYRSRGSGIFVRFRSLNHSQLTAQDHDIIQPADILSLMNTKLKDQTVPDAEISELFKTQVLGKYVRSDSKLPPFSKSIGSLLCCMSGSSTRFRIRRHG